MRNNIIDVHCSGPPVKGRQVQCNKWTCYTHLCRACVKTKHTTCCTNIGDAKGAINGVYKVSFEEEKLCELRDCRCNFLGLL